MSGAMYDSMKAPPPGAVEPRDICWTRARPCGRSTECSSAVKAGYSASPTCSPISTVDTASYPPRKSGRPATSR